MSTQKFTFFCSRLSTVKDFFGMIARSSPPGMSRDGSSMGRACALVKNIRRRKSIVPHYKLALALFASTSALASSAGILTVLLPQPPVTLNPRMATDAYGQKLGALVFRALTRIDPDLEP